MDVMLCPYSKEDEFQCTNQIEDGEIRCYRCPIYFEFLESENG